MPGRRRRPRSGHKQLSQNFLRSGRLARRLVALSSITDTDLVVEAGPGRGQLTSALAEVAHRVIGIELDSYLAPRLREKFDDDRRIHILSDDFLQFNLPDTPYKFFSNIPFSRTADIVRKLTLSDRPPEDAYLIVQAAAATRFLGQPFGPESALSLQVKARFDLSILAWLNPTDFDPPPSVNSVLLRLNRLNSPRITSSELREFDRFSDLAMRSGNRSTKTLLRHLVSSHILRGLTNDLAFPSNSPPSDIDFEHWLALFRIQKWIKG